MDTGRRFTFFAACESTQFGRVVSSFGGGTGFRLEASVVADALDNGLASDKGDGGSTTSPSAVDLLLSIDRLSEACDSEETAAGKPRM
jgi:hypothetical protein